DVARIKVAHHGIVAPVDDGGFYRRSDFLRQFVSFGGVRQGPDPGENREPGFCRFVPFRAAPSVTLVIADQRVMVPFPPMFEFLALTLGRGVCCCRGFGVGGVECGGIDLKRGQYSEERWMHRFHNPRLSVWRKKLRRTSQKSEVGG